MIAANSPLIFWAEDDEDDVYIINQSLNHFDFKVDIRFFNNGFSLLQEIQECERVHIFPDMIVLDINMPVLSGDELYERIKAYPDFNQVTVAFFSTSFKLEHSVFLKEMVYPFMS